MAEKVSYFMGANTPKGFFSLFDGLYDPFSNRKCYILKGGPGTGKSTFMRRIGAAAQNCGYECEYIFCASDPDSLDAIIIPEIDVCFADGTAPHIIEPKFPGAVEQLVDLGEYWIEKAIYPHADEIRSLTLEISRLHARSVRFINAAGILRADTQRVCLEHIDESKISSFAVRLTRRELSCIKEGNGKVERRFLSAVTPKGVYTHSNTISSLCSRVIGINDEYIAAGGILLERIKNEAVNMGRRVISCVCPLEPDGYPEHLIIPEDGLALVSLRQAHNLHIKPDRIIHSSRFFADGEMSSIRYRCAFNKTSGIQLILEAVKAMKGAKEAHDSLERYYAGAMNFKAADKRCAQIMANLFKK